MFDKTMNNNASIPTMRGQFKVTINYKGRNSLIPTMRCQ